VSGLLVVYTGNGKGKTTAALGLCLRAIGHGLKVGFLQFMKGSKEYGEVRMAANLPGFELLQCGRDSFVSPDQPEEIDIVLARGGLTTFKTWLTAGKFDLIVLDEVLVAIAYKLLPIQEVVDILESRSPEVDIVLTGRYAPEEIIQLADTVTVMSERRHAYQRGAVAKAGMEF